MASARESNNERQLVLNNPNEVAGIISRMGYLEQFGSLQNADIIFEANVWQF